MEMCSCWELRPNAELVQIKEGYTIYKDKQICNGTKEREECSCNGNEEKCNFYPEKRKVGKAMNTAEMYLQAQKDGKYYRCNSMVYQKDKGLMDDYMEEWGGLGNWNTPGAFDELMAGEWELWDSVMTRAEAEKKFGIKIID